MDIFLTLIASSKKVMFWVCWFVCMSVSLQLLATQNLTDGNGNFRIARQWYTKQLIKLWGCSDNAIWGQ